MFTGIIEDLGTIVKIGKTGLEVQTGLNDLKTGDSISVNGVCLTITKIQNPKSKIQNIGFEISQETLNITNLGELRTGDRVNLERAMKADSRFGGHIVTGHIEGTGRILSIKEANNSKIYSFTYPKGLGKYIVQKGSIAIDGISLTIAEINDKCFSVSVIPFTLENTILKFKKTGSTVNIETDILGKYAEKSKIIQKESSIITKDFLKEKGFI